jgi:hypothetical protein
MPVPVISRPPCSAARSLGGIGGLQEQRDFEVFVAADCTSAPGAAHEAALSSMAVFATVGPWRELLTGLQAGSAPAGATA